MRSHVHKNEHEAFMFAFAYFGTSRQYRYSSEVHARGREVRSDHQAVMGTGALEVNAQVDILLGGIEAVCKVW